MDSSEVNDGDSEARCHCVCTGSPINGKTPKIVVRDEKNLAGLNRDFRFTGQKHICPALQDERRTDPN